MQSFRNVIIALETINRGERIMIPYRDSKLTRLLQGKLFVDSKIVSDVGPFALHITVSLLKFVTFSKIPLHVYVFVSLQENCVCCFHFADCSRINTVSRYTCTKFCI